MSDDTKAAITEKVISIIAEQLSRDEAEVKPEAAIIDDLGADSLDVVELVMHLEESFDTDIDDAEAEKLKTVQDCIDYVVEITEKQKG